jgi:hypothetical protein
MGFYLRPIGYCLVLDRVLFETDWLLFSSR